MENQRVIRQEIANTPEISKETLDTKRDLKPCVIHSNELSEIYNEWNAVQKGDLFVNEELYRKLQEYIQYQKNLKPLKQELAEQLIEKYIVPENFCDTNDTKGFRVYVNNKYVTYAILYFHTYGGSTRGIIQLKHLVYITAALGNNIVSYIEKSRLNEFFDLRLWIYDMNGTIEVNDKDIQITIP